MGRLKAGGQVFYIGRVRWEPWRHSDALHSFLSRFCAVGQNEKLEMLQQLIDGSGYNPNLLPSDNGGEDAATKEFFDSFL